MRDSRVPKVLGALAAVLVLCAVLLVANGIHAGTQAKNESSEILSALVGAMPQTHVPLAYEQQSQELPSVELDGHRYLGYVKVPSVDIELPVASEYTSERLAVVPCRLTGSIANHDLVIFANRYESQFGPLENVDIGATVRLVLVDGSLYDYVVSNYEIVDVRDVDYMVHNRHNSASPADWDLTLYTYSLDGQTCYAARCELA